MLLVDLEAGKIIQDEELKQQVIGRNDYKQIIKKNLTSSKNNYRKGDYFLCFKN